MSVEASAVQGVEELFAAYADALNDFDSEAITDLFCYPATIWQFGKGHVFAHREDLLENVDALLAAFDGAGVVTSSFTIEAAQSDAGAASAFVSVLWVQDDDSGEPVHEFQCSYLLLDHDGDWRIASVVNLTDSE